MAACPRTAPARRCRSAWSSTCIEEHWTIAGKKDGHSVHPRHGKELVVDNEEYLGDGLYASFDGYQFRLRAPRGLGDHVVYLDRHVVRAFELYVNKVMEQGEQA
jgi:hypothetical protein